MFTDKDGKKVLELDSRILAITRKDEELQVKESEFFNAIKAYKLSESLQHFAFISKMIFDDKYPPDWHRMGKGGVCHPSGVFLTQFSIEYLASAMILSGSNDWKKESLKRKDNILGLFNIYQNGLVQGIPSSNGLMNFMIPMYFQQITSQADPKDLFTRQWYFFSQINTRLNTKSSLELSEVFQKETSLSLLEYTKLCFIIFAYATVNPRFNIGEVGGLQDSKLKDVFNDEKIALFLDIVSSDYAKFRELDKQLNGKLDPIFTKTRFNPLWLKPIVKLGENDFLVPSITAYMTSTFKGLFWWFDSYFRAVSKSKQTDFRIHFGKVFEEYVGDVLKNIYSEVNVQPEIQYGTKKNSRLFFDWIVETKEKTFLFEAKSYQFPLEVLQKGDPEMISNQILSKIIETIIQMFKRVADVPKFEELQHLVDKNLIPIAIFYDIPLISTPLYNEHISKVLKLLESQYPNISNFNYYFLSIEELENFGYAVDKIDIDDLMDRANKTTSTGFMVELGKVCKENESGKKNLLDISFNNYCADVIGIKSDI
jgi:hypothetical protein